MDYPELTGYLVLAPGCVMTFGIVKGVGTSPSSSYGGPYPT